MIRTHNCFRKDITKSKCEVTDELLREIEEAQEALWMDYTDLSLGEKRICLTLTSQEESPLKPRVVKQPRTPSKLKSGCDMTLNSPQDEILRASPTDTTKTVSSPEALNAQLDAQEKDEPVIDRLPNVAEGSYYSPMYSPTSPFYSPTIYDDRRVESRRNHPRRSRKQIYQRYPRYRAPSRGEKLWYKHRRSVESRRNHPRRSRKSCHRHHNGARSPFTKNQRTLGHRWVPPERTNSLPRSEESLVLIIPSKSIHDLEHDDEAIKININDLSQSLQLYHIIG